MAFLFGFWFAVSVFLVVGALLFTACLARLRGWLRWGAAGFVSILLIGFAVGCCRDPFGEWTWFHELGHLLWFLTRAHFHRLFLSVLGWYLVLLVSLLVAFGIGLRRDAEQPRRGKAANWSIRKLMITGGIAMASAVVCVSQADQTTCRRLREKIADVKAWHSQRPLSDDSRVECESGDYSRFALEQESKPWPEWTSSGTDADLDRLATREQIAAFVTSFDVAMLRETAAKPDLTVGPVPDPQISDGMISAARLLTIDCRVALWERDHERAWKDWMALAQLADQAGCQSSLGMLMIRDAADSTCSRLLSWLLADGSVPTDEAIARINAWPGDRRSIVPVCVSNFESMIWEVYCPMILSGRPDQLELPSHGIPIKPFLRSPILERALLIPDDLESWPAFVTAFGSAMEAPRGEVDERLGDVQNRIMSAGRHPLASAPGKSPYYGRLVETAGPYLIYVGFDVIKLETRLDLARVAVALHRFRCRTGDAPTSLEELIPNELASLPTDPYSKSPYLWRLTANGDVTVWSVGDNKVDDNGVEGARPADDLAFTLKRALRGEQ